MARKLQVLPFLLIFTALPMACTKIRKKPEKAIITVKMGSYSYLSSNIHIVSRYNQRLLLSSQIKPFSIVYRDAFCPNTLTFLEGFKIFFQSSEKTCTRHIHLKTRREQDDTLQSCGQGSRDLAELQGIADPSNQKVICTSESQAYSISQHCGLRNAQAH